MNVSQKDSTILADQSLATDLNADVGSNRDKRPAQVGALPQLLKSAFVASQCVDRSFLLIKLRMYLLIGEFAFSI